jgi:hypothetical protein
MTSKPNVHQQLEQHFRQALAAELPKPEPTPEQNEAEQLRTELEAYRRADGMIQQ